MMETLVLLGGFLAFARFIYYAISELDFLKHTKPH